MSPWAPGGIGNLGRFVILASLVVGLVAGSLLAGSAAGTPLPLEEATESSRIPAEPDALVTFTADGEPHPRTRIPSWAGPAPDRPLTQEEPEVGGVVEVPAVEGLPVLGRELAASETPTWEGVPGQPELPGGPPALEPVRLVPDPGSSVAATPAPDPETDRTPHPTIVVVGDEGPTGFALAQDPVTDTTIPRPGSGVRSGSGTADDPYVISGWSVAGIRIEDTDAHVEIHDNRIRDPRDDAVPVRFGGTAPRFETPIVLEDADNVTVAGNEIVQGDDGDAAGVAARDADRLEVTGNTFGEEILAGVAAEDGTGLDVHDQTFEAPVGVAAFGVDHMAIRNSTFEGVDEGVIVEDPDGVRLTGNEVTNSGTFAILYQGETGAIAPEPDLRAVGNDVRHTSTGIFLDDDVGGLVSDNAFRTVGVGVAGRDAGDVTVEGNAFEGGWGVLAGVLFDGAADLDVLDNTLQGIPFAVGTSGDYHYVERNTIAGALVAIHAGDGRQPWIDGNRVRDSTVGVSLANATEPTVVDNDLDRVYAGIIAGDVRRGSVLDNEAGGSDLGLILAQGTTGLDVRRNRVEDATAAVLLDEAPQNRLAKNTFTTGGVYLQGEDRRDFHQTIPASNTVAGEPLQYVWNATDADLTLEGGQAIVAGSRNTTVEAGTYQGVAAGLQVAASENVTVTGPVTGNTTVGALLLANRDVVVQDLDARRTLVGAASIAGDGTVIRSPTVAPGPSGSVAVLASEADRNLTVEAGNLTDAEIAVASIDALGTTLRGTAATNVTYGVLDYRSRGTSLADTRLDASYVDAYLLAARNASLARNAFLGGGLAVFPSSPDDRPGHAIPPSNTVDGEPLRYEEGLADATVPAPAGQVVLLDPDNVTVPALDLGPATYAAEVVGGSDVSLRDTRLTGDTGLLAHASRDLSVQGARADDVRVGASLWYAPRPEVTGSVVEPGTPDPTTPKAGLVLLGSEDAVLADNVFRGAGVVPFSSPGLSTDGDTVNGEPLVYHEDATNVTVTPPAGQVVLRNVTDATLDDLDVDEATYGVVALDSRDVRVTGSSLGGQATGVYADDTTVHVEDTNLSGNLRGALHSDGAATHRNVLVDGVGRGTGILDLGADLAVRNATIRDHGDGVFTFFEGASIRDTNLTSNRVGLFAIPAFGPVDVHRSNVQGNADLGARILGLQAVNLTGNYWGCPGGPDAPACDDVAGPAFVDPWLEAPNLEAGYEP